MFASSFFAALLLSVVCARAQDFEHTIKSNLEYRMTKGDLPALSFGLERPKAVQVTEGAEALLEDCLNRPATWSQDSLVFRLAHTHAVSIKSCRENASPSMHVVFRSLPDGTL